jgi:hypothetical protein
LFKIVDVWNDSRWANCVSNVENQLFTIFSNYWLVIDIITSIMMSILACKSFCFLGEIDMQIFLFWDVPR